MFFIGVNPEVFAIESYDDAPADMWANENDGYWAKDGNHVVKLNA